MIVSSHLAQMRTFMLRRGVEFYAEQDSFGSRKDFIAKVCEDNMLDMKLESIIDYFLCDGQGLFYFRPSGDSYQLLFFPKDQYRAYRDQNNEIENKGKNTLDQQCEKKPSKNKGTKKCEHCGEMIYAPRLTIHVSQCKIFSKFFKIFKFFNFFKFSKYSKIFRSFKFFKSSSSLNTSSSSSSLCP